MNNKNQLVDVNGNPLKDHKGNIITVPVEYEYMYTNIDEISL
jgi:flagellar basal body rod protein FlgG